MPTTHVEPGSDPLLQEIATGLWKSKKVVVITGAGISTNSGIPDFRSENGLYSLIQAQFDAADANNNNASQGAERGEGSDSDGPDAGAEQRPAKRQRRTYDSSPGVPFPGLRQANVKEVPPKVEEREQEEVPAVVVDRAGEDQASQAVQDTIVVGDISKAAGACSTTPLTKSLPRPGPAREGEGNAAAGLSPMQSSPPAGFFSTPPPNSRLRPPHLIETLPGSSSPLSSPPAIVYDPYQTSTPSCPSTQDSDEAQSSRSDSEEPSSVTTPLLSSSQNSFSGASKNTLPVMKGRDLFDAQIWSCPIRTSVFYAFVSALREKVRTAEPTTSHRFVSVLRDSRKLVRCYTQNIDQLEERVGLSTSLDLGAGSRYRFSVRAGRKGAQGSLQTEKSQSQSQGEPSADDGKDIPSASQASQTALESKVDDEPPSSAPPASQSQQPAAAPGPNRGVECVCLHGSLAELRCFVCARTASWEGDARLSDTLAGRQPDCPHCAGATAAREERGKRALGVGKLRPDIVLYGEEHPHSHLISPLVQHDLSLGPDMLLILGTSLRVHGLKVLVREFAKAVHDRGGKVVFVNFTKPPESVWSDIIDYWVQWDCDAWVDDLQVRKPALWLPPGTVLPEEEKEKTKPKGSRRQSGEKGSKKNRPREPKVSPDAKRPSSVRDHKQNGAYLVCKIMDDLRRLSGEDGQPAWSSAAAASATPSPVQPVKKRRGRPRKSAPALLDGAVANANTAPVTATPVSAADQPRNAAALPRPDVAGFASSPVRDTAMENVPGSDQGGMSISAAVKSRKRKQTVWRMVRGVETRVVLENETVPAPASAPIPLALPIPVPAPAVEAQVPPTSALAHTPAISRPTHPTPVPEDRRLPSPTPTILQQPPRYTPDGISDRPASALDMAIDAGFRETDRLIAQLSRPATPAQLRLAPLLGDGPENRVPPEFTQRGQKRPSLPMDQAHYPHHDYQPRPTTASRPAPLEPKLASPGPRKLSISSNVGSPVAPTPGRDRSGSQGYGDGHGPFFMSDPLASWLGYPPYWLQQELQGGQMQGSQLQGGQAGVHGQGQQGQYGQPGPHGQHGHSGPSQEQAQYAQHGQHSGVGALLQAHEQMVSQSRPSSQGQAHHPAEMQQQHHYQAPPHGYHQAQHHPSYPPTYHQHHIPQQGQHAPHPTSNPTQHPTSHPTSHPTYTTHPQPHSLSQQQQKQLQQLDSALPSPSGAPRSPWCPDEQLRKEQEAAMMLSALRGSGSVPGTPRVANVKSGSGKGGKGKAARGV
ncbi:hypothetical protein B0J18DRAFT_447378 [Chaetomium sp. MPI-SDFR-AT-0129]|nr:hypothetical protein B0J18DRAFT_447378 [Chaetomium sp. MPI-SDFR-AT-0129]